MGCSGLWEPTVAGTDPSHPFVTKATRQSVTFTCCLFLWNLAVRKAHFRLAALMGSSPNHSCDRGAQCCYRHNLRCPFFLWRHRTCTGKNLEHFVRKKGEGYSQYFQLLQLCLTRRIFFFISFRSPFGVVALLSLPTAGL